MIVYPNIPCSSSAYTHPQMVNEFNFIFDFLLCRGSLANLLTYTANRFYCARNTCFPLNRMSDFFTTVAVIMKNIQFSSFQWCFFANAWCASSTIQCVMVFLCTLKMGNDANCHTSQRKNILTNMCSISNLMEIFNYQLMIQHNTWMNIGVFQLPIFSSASSISMFDTAYFFKRRLQYGVQGLGDTVQLCTAYINFVTWHSAHRIILAER